MLAAVLFGLVARRSSRTSRGSCRIVRLAGIPEGAAAASDELGKELAGKAILIGWDPGPDERSAQNIDPEWTPEESLEELKSLCGAIGVETKESFLQQWRPGRGRFPIGKGKMEDFRQQVKDDPEIGLMVFDMDLPHRSLLTLKGRIDPEDRITMLDRTSLILRIFASRARTREAELQVALASQQYLASRLRFYLTEGGGLEGRGGSAAGSSQGGSGGGALRGRGETQLSDDKFIMNRKISDIKRDLEAVRLHRAIDRSKRKELGVPIVSLVGYTNAGKSTLMNALCGKSEVVAQDRLFETLDSTRRNVKLEGGREIMIVDTVGFVQRLPTQLVEGFRATLEEVSEATMVLHVIDTSSRTAPQQVATVLRTLNKLPSYEMKTPQLLVFNKVDKLEGGLPEELQKSLEIGLPGVVGHVQISALSGYGMSSLAQAIEETLLKHTAFGAKRTRVLIPYTESSWYAKLRGSNPLGKITQEEHLVEGYLLDVVATEDGARRIQQFEVSPEEYHFSQIEATTSEEDVEAKVKQLLEDEELEELMRQDAQEQEEEDWGDIDDLEEDAPKPGVAA